MHNFVRHRSVAAVLASLLALALTQSCGNRAATEPADAYEIYESGNLVVDLYDLHESLGSGQSRMDADAERLLSESLNVPDADPNWPTLAFLAGEIELRRGNIGDAERSFRQLATWGSSTEPNTDESDSRSSDSGVGWRFSKATKPRRPTGRPKRSRWP